MTVNLGPVNLIGLNGKTDSSSSIFAYNPRCLKRSLADDANQRFANETGVLNLLTGPKDIYDFEYTLQGWPNTTKQGVHGGGHFSLGGDPSLDLYVSPGDPAFWVHHSNIDRIWWQWQMLEPETRTSGASAISGTFSMYDAFEPHRNGTLDDVIDLGFISPGRSFQLGELLKTTSGPFCYVYE